MEIENRLKAVGYGEISGNTIQDLRSSGLIKQTQTGFHAITDQERAAFCRLVMSRLHALKKERF